MRAARDIRSMRQAAEGRPTPCADRPGQRAAVCERMRPRQLSSEFKVAGGPDTRTGRARRTESRTRSRPRVRRKPLPSSTMMSDSCPAAPAVHRATTCGQSGWFVCSGPHVSRTCNEALKMPKCSTRLLACGTRGKPIACEGRLACARFKRAASPALNPR